MLHVWKKQADKLSAGEISMDNYDLWRYYYPKYDITQLWAKVPSQELSDALVEAFQDKPKKTNKNDKKPLAMESLPTAEGFIIWISFATQPLVNHSVIHDLLDYKNNGSCMAVIKLLSKDFSKFRKPA